MPNGPRQGNSGIYLKKTYLWRLKWGTTLKITRTRTVGERMKFFAYDVHMLPACMQALIPEAKVIGTGKVPGYQLRFNRRCARDGSGKCNLARVHSPLAFAYGRVYDIPLAQKKRLDLWAGLGYGGQDLSCKVLLPGEVCYAFTYIAHQQRLDPTIKPFTWYRDKILAAAILSDLEGQYIRDIAQVLTLEDGDSSRNASQYAFLQSLNVPRQHRQSMRQVFAV